MSNKLGLESWISGHRDQDYTLQQTSSLFMLWFIVQTGISILPTDDYSDLIGYFNTGKIKYLSVKLQLCKNYLSSPH